MEVPLQAQDIEIYSTQICPYCDRAKALLRQKNVEFVEYKIDGNNEMRQAMMDRADGRRTVPQIFIKGQHIGGCDDLYALDRAGKLDPLLT